MIDLRLIFIPFSSRIHLVDSKIVRRYYVFGFRIIDLMCTLEEHFKYGVEMGYKVTLK